MDLWQVGRQFKHRLEDTVWEETPGNVAVLTGGAFVSIDGDGHFLQVVPDTDDEGADDDTEGQPIWEKPGSAGLPYARVEVRGGDVDEAGRVDQVHVRVIVVAGGFEDGDRHGEQVLEGGEREATNGQGQSTGRAIDEVVSRLLQSAFGAGVLVESTHGVQGFLRSMGPVERVEGPEVVSRTLDFVVTSGSVRRTYGQPYRFTASALGGGQVALSWVNPPDRFDRYKVILRRAAGSTAPASASSGTGVTLSGDLATSVTVSGLSAGAHSFSIFVAYDETHDPHSTEERYSDALSKTVTVT